MTMEDWANTSAGASPGKLALLSQGGHNHLTGGAGQDLYPVAASAAAVDERERPWRLHAHSPGRRRGRIAEARVLGVAARGDGVAANRPARPHVLDRHPGLASDVAVDTRPAHGGPGRLAPWAGDFRCRLGVVLAPTQDR